MLRNYWSCETCPCLLALQNIEHLKWKPQQLHKAFSFEHVNNAAVDWLGPQQLEAVRNHAETRYVIHQFQLVHAHPL